MGRGRALVRVGGQCMEERREYALQSVSWRGPGVQGSGVRGRVQWRCL